MTAPARARARSLVLAAAACLALAAGCSPVLVAQSSPPPGRSARLEEIKGFWGVKGYRMELSQGVALAMACYQGGPCEGLAVASDNPAIAEIRRASLGTLERRGIYGTAPAAAVVVVGKAPGTTLIRVRSKDGSRNVTVTVVPPPGPITTQATSTPPPAPAAIPAPAAPAPPSPVPAAPAKPAAPAAPAKPAAAPAAPAAPAKPAAPAAAPAAPAKPAAPAAAPAAPAKPPAPAPAPH